MSSQFWTKEKEKAPPTNCPMTFKRAVFRGHGLRFKTLVQNLAPTQDLLLTLLKTVTAKRKLRRNSLDSLLAKARQNTLLLTSPQSGSSLAEESTEENIIRLDDPNQN